MSAMNAGTAETRTEMSFLYGRCGARLSVMPSRNFHNAAACASLWLMTPSLTRPALQALLRTPRARLAVARPYAGVELGDHVIRRIFGERPLRAVRRHVMQRTIGEELECAQRQTAHGRRRIPASVRSMAGTANSMTCAAGAGSVSFSVASTTMTERTFGTDDEVTQVVAGRILRQATIRDRADRPCAVTSFNPAIHSRVLP